MHTVARYVAFVAYNYLITITMIAQVLLRDHLNPSDEFHQEGGNRRERT